VCPQLKKTKTRMHRILLKVEAAESVKITFILLPIDRRLEILVRLGRCFVKLRVVFVTREKCSTLNLEKPSLILI